jgi:hypothetical protein
VFMTPPCIRPAVRKQAARRTASRLLLKHRRWVTRFPRTRRRPSRHEGSVAEQRDALSAGFVQCAVEQTGDL